MDSLDTTVVGYRGRLPWSAVMVVGCHGGRLSWWSYDGLLAIQDNGIYAYTITYTDMQSFILLDCLNI